MIEDIHLMPVGTRAPVHRRTGPVDRFGGEVRWGSERDFGLFLSIGRYSLNSENPPHRVLSQRLYLGAKRKFLRTLSRAHKMTVATVIAGQVKHIRTTVEQPGFGPARTGVPFSDRCTDDPKPFGP